MTAVLGAIAALFAVTAGFLAVAWARARRRPSAPASAVAEAADTSDQQPAYESVQDRIRVLEGVAASAPDGVVVVDRDGHEIQRNAAAERYRGARHADALAERSINEQLDVSLAGERTNRELELFGPPPRVLRIMTEPLRVDDRIVGAVAFVRDISESRRVEAIRRDFVANVSHELKTPIGALMLLAETLSDTDDTAALMSLAPRVQHEAERLARIVEDLLDLSLLEAQAEPEREPIAVVDLLNETAERVRSSADAAGIKIVVDEPSSRLRARLDRRWIGSALVNLLDNAVKYSDPGGVVTVGAAAEGDELVIDVRDEGIGIPTRDLDRIFERFYRVDRARSRATGGTGLGLSIVRHVAEAHHGSVSAHSTEGVGSVFHLSLPGAVAARPSLSEAS